VDQGRIERLPAARCPSHRLGLFCCSQVRLVAVSKIKPAELVQEVYDTGHRHFGENYVSPQIRRQDAIQAAGASRANVVWQSNACAMSAARSAVLMSGTGR